MLNHIWAWILIIGVLFGVFAGVQKVATAPGGIMDKFNVARDVGKNITNGAIKGADTAVEICLSLIGKMALWLGVMKVAEDAGLIKALARMIKPIMRMLFPEVPTEHPANGAMMMNIAANMLGLDNAATPFGLKAMVELQTLNKVKDTATNAMATFLAINTSNVNIIPFTIIAYRASEPYLSKNAATIFFPTLIATTISTIVAVIAVKAFQNMKIFTEGNANSSETSESKEGLK